MLAVMHKLTLLIFLSREISFYSTASSRSFAHWHHYVLVIGRCTTTVLSMIAQGHYCDQAGLSAVAGPCDAQYHCHKGATTATPTVGISTSMYSSGAFNSTGLSYGGAACTAGHYCPAGTVDPLQCLPGTYMSHTTASVCDACPVEYYCPLLGTVTPVACPQGSYCPLSTGAVTPKCPVGTYGAAASLAVVQDCTPCTAGKYCGVTVSHSSAYACIYTVVTSLYSIIVASTAAKLLGQLVAT